MLKRERALIDQGGRHERRMTSLRANGIITNHKSWKSEWPGLKQECPLHHAMLRPIRRERPERAHNRKIVSRLTKVFAGFVDIENRRQYKLFAQKIQDRNKRQT
jgi:hypothetical protein